MTVGIALINAERKKQIDRYGFTAEHHAKHPEWYNKRQLITASINLMLIKDGDTEFPPCPDNWQQEWWDSLCRKSNTDRIVISGALVAAELDRLVKLLIIDK